MGRYGRHNDTNYHRDHYEENNSRSQQDKEDYQNYLKRENTIHQNHAKNQSNHGVSQDWDSSKKPKKSRYEVTQDWEQQSERPTPSIVSRIGGGIKQRYEKYNSVQAKAEREARKFDKRDKTISDLQYNSKKEKLRADIRKSKSTAPSDFGFGFGSSGGASKGGKGGRGRSPSSGEGYAHLPRQNYDGMNRMFGIGNSGTPKRSSAKPVNRWGSMDRMFGGL